MAEEGLNTISAKPHLPLFSSLSFVPVSSASPSGTPAGQRLTRLRPEKSGQS
jgi:hypothetical protein